MCQWTECPSTFSQLIYTGTSLVVQRLRLCAPNAGGLDSNPRKGRLARPHPTPGPMPQLKIPGAVTETKDPACHNQDLAQPNKWNKYFFFLIKSLPAMQGTWVRSLVQKDSTCNGATEPIHHNHWSPRTYTPAPQQEKPPQWDACTLQLESSPWQLQLERSPCTARKTQYSQELKKESPTQEPPPSSPLYRWRNWGTIQPVSPRAYNA